MGFKYTGKYTQAFLSDKKIKAESIESDFYKKIIEVKPNEAIYIYSFKGNRLLFVKGFEDALNKKDEDLSIIELNSLYTPEFKEFVDEYHDRLLLFLYNNNKNIATFSSHTIMKINGMNPPFMFNVKVHKTDENGNLLSIIGRCTFAKNLKTTDIVQYSLSGNFKDSFIDTINHDLNFKKCISLFNIKIIEGLEKGKNIIEISNTLNTSEEKIKKCIDKLLNKFELQSEDELIEFAKSNYLIPNQFEGFMN